jgi:hypothetical protein
MERYPERTDSLVPVQHHVLPFGFCTPRLNRTETPVSFSSFESHHAVSSRLHHRAAIPRLAGKHTIVPFNPAIDAIVGRHGTLCASFEKLWLSGLIYGEVSLENYGTE